MFVRIPVADFGSRFDWHILPVSMATTEKKQDFYVGCLSFTLVTGNSVTVSFMSHKRLKAWFAKRVWCLCTFLGGHYLFVHWDSCSQIPQDRNIWEHLAYILRTRAWRCTTASRRKPQVGFLGKQEKKECVVGFSLLMWSCPFLHWGWNASSPPSRQPLFIISEPCHYFEVSTLILLDSVILLEVFRGSLNINGNLRAAPTCPPILPHRRRWCFSPVFTQVIPTHWRSPTKVNGSTSTSTDLYNQANHAGKFCHQKKGTSLDFCFSYPRKVAELQKNESKHHA